MSVAFKSLRRRGLIAAVAATLSLVTATAVAVVLPAGAGPLALPGTVGFAAGTVIADDVVPFTILVGGAGSPIYFQGSLQRRVVRLASGELAFGFRVRDTVPGFNGNIRYLISRDFGGFATEIDYDPSSPGTRNPQTASRSAAGSEVGVDFAAQSFPGNLESRFYYIRTNATCYALRGSTHIQTTTGQGVDVPTYAPAIDCCPADFNHDGIVNSADFFEFLNAFFAGC